MIRGHMTHLLSWIRAVLHEWITLLSGCAITVGVGLWERYSQKPIPGIVYATMVTLFVLVANFKAYLELESRWLTERQKNQTRPHIRVDDYYVDTRYIGTGGQYNTPISCLHVKFTNDPPFPAEEAIGRDVIAQLAYKDAAAQLLFELRGRWGDSEQPTRPGQSIVQLEPTDFPIGALRELDLAFKYPADADCYAMNNETYRMPDWRDPRRVLRGERFGVCVRLRAAGVDQSWVFRFRNLGPGKGLACDSHETVCT